MGKNVTPCNPPLTQTMPKGNQPAPAGVEKATQRNTTPRLLTNCWFIQHGVGGDANTNERTNELCTRYSSERGSSVDWMDISIDWSLGALHKSSENFRGIIYFYRAFRFSEYSTIAILLVTKHCKKETELAPFELDGFFDLEKDHAMQ